MLTKSNVDTLRRNSELWAGDTRELYLMVDKTKDQVKAAAGAPAEKPVVEAEKPISEWQWVYPEIRRRKK